jgi:ATP-binding cassette, subfamily B, bacterial MsbA
MKTFRWMVKYARPYWKNALLNIFFNILAVIFSLVSLTMVIPFLSLLFGTQKIVTVKPEFHLSTTSVADTFNYYFSQLIIQYGPGQTLFYFSLTVLVLFALKNLFSYLAMFFVARLRNGISMDIRQDVYNKILSLPLAFLSKERKGDLMARMTNDISEVEWTILTSMEAIFKEPIAVLSFVITLVVMSPQLSLFIMIMLPLTGIIIGKVGKTLKKASAEGQHKMGLMLSFIEETLSGLRIIKAFTAETFISNKFYTLNNNYRNLMIRMYRRRDLASPLSETLGVMVLVTVMWYGGSLVLENKTGLQPSVFIAFIVIFSQVLSPAKAFTTAYYNVQKGIASADRIKMILDAPDTILETKNPVRVSDFGKEIKYENVSFAYGEKDVLKNINLTLTKGKTIALVGQSGAGKSTMADLLPRFYDVTKGKITIDGTDLREMKFTDIRKLMGIVTQESILFNDTIFNNIAFGMEEATEEDVVNAAKIANAHEFIIQMENGYQTNIGDRGLRLSGGQRQRMSIARAVLKNPPILVLDEATSALDTESERLVQDALFHLMQNRTSLIIAHRLSTILHADEIVVMHQGEIIERGTHSQLLETGGIYKKLYELQAFA